MFEYEVWQGALSRTTTKAQKAINKKFDSEPRYKSEGKLLISPEDPLVVDLIDENQFINSIAGPKLEDDSIIITSSPKSGSIKKTFTLT